MEDFKIDWSKEGSDLLQEIIRWRKTTILRNVTALDKLNEQLIEQDIFNHKDFKKVRFRVGTQKEWGDRTGVSQATIGNYERSETYPNKNTRLRLVDAIRFFREREAAKLQGKRNLDVELDAVEAKKTADNSILDAALTDFRFDAEEQRVIAVPFNLDVVEAEIEEIEQDKKDLLESLGSQADDLAISLEKGANASVSRMVESLKSYARETEKKRPNPRKLFRLGTNVFRASSNDDIVFGVNDWDRQSLDGFVADHNELMRLHYKEALAKAQKVDAAHVPDDADLPSGKEFQEVAEVIENAKDSDGQALFDSDISTLLKDIGREIEEQAEAEILTSDPERKKALRRRRVEAIKNGSIMLGRFLFVTSFFIAVDPAVALGTAGSVASILGLVESSSPGIVKKYYEKIRAALPFLPRLPGSK